MRYAFILLSLTLLLAACGSPAPDTSKEGFYAVPVNA